MKHSFLLLFVLPFFQNFAFAEEATTNTSAPAMPIVAPESMAENSIAGTCNSFEVFQRSVNYLKQQKELPFSMPQIFKAAMEIDKGCNGADRRFQRVFEMLAKSGVDTQKSYEIALDFAKMTDEKTDNFMVLFKGLFLENKFDLDFKTAFKISLQLSAGLPAQWQKIRTDFESFLKFCTDVKKIELPIGICAEWTLSIMKQEEKFPQGIYPSFEKIHTFLTSRKGPQLNVKNRLELISEILAYGPKSPDNFQKALEWMNTLNGDGVEPEKAHKFALQIAKNSLPIERETDTEKAAKK